MSFFDIYKYPIFGGLAGLLLAVLLIAFGFFKTLLILLLVAVGAIVGLYCQKTGILDPFFNRYTNNK